MKPAAHKMLMSRRGRENPFMIADPALEKLMLDYGYITRRQDGLVDLSRRGREYIRNHARRDRRAA